VTRPDPSESAAPAARGFRQLLRGRILRFILTGGLNSVFSYSLFAALQVTLGHQAHYLVILFVSNIISILEAYVMQRWLVWRVRGHWWQELARFSGVYLLVLVINAVLLPIFHELAGIPILAAQAVIMLINAFATFTIHRRFTFKSSLSGSSPDH